MQRGTKLEKWDKKRIVNDFLIENFVKVLPYRGCSLINDCPQHYSMQDKLLQAARTYHMQTTTKPFANNTAIENYGYVLTMKRLGLC